MSVLPGFNGEAGRWFEQWPEGLIGVDHAGTMLFVSPKAESILRWQNRELINLNVHSSLCARSRGMAHDEAECPLLKKSPCASEVHSAFWLDNHGNNVGVDFRVFELSGAGETHRVISFQDNFELDHNSAELNKFAEYVEHSPSFIGEFDCEGQLLFANTALQNQLIESGFDDDGNMRIYPGNLADLCHKICEQREIIGNVQVNVDERWFSWHLYPLHAAGEPSVMAYGFDITDQKKAEAILEKEKAAARRDFYAKMIHELRTPLNAIIGFSQVMMRRLEKSVSERDIHYLKSINMAGLQLNDMVSDTLDAAKIDAGKMSVENENFRVVQVIESIGPQIETLANGKKLDFQYQCDQHLTLISDPRRVRQILLNLISNAIKYTKKGAVKLRVFADFSEYLGEIITIEVEDSGMGIPDDQMDKLFGSYERVNESQIKDVQGTGLGLSLVAEIVALLGGGISVKSEVNVGSVFRVELPLGAED